LHFSGGTFNNLIKSTFTSFLVQCFPSLPTFSAAAAAAAACYISVLLSTMSHKKKRDEVSVGTNKFLPRNVRGTTPGNSK
jgi:ABC-type uncharacterized transport system permease subunit